MSVLNLGLQCIGLMRERMSDEFETLSSRCNSLSDLRKAEEKFGGFSDEVADSVTPVKILLSDIFVRLELKSKKYSVFSSASASAIFLFCDALLSVDSALTDPHGKYKKVTLARSPSLRQFFEHCCHSRHHTFSVRKCGNTSCSMCKPVSGSLLMCLRVFIIYLILL